MRNLQQKKHLQKLARLQEKRKEKLKKKNEETENAVEEEQIADTSENVTGLAEKQKSSKILNKGLLAIVYMYCIML